MVDKAIQDRRAIALYAATPEGTENYLGCTCPGCGSTRVRSIRRITGYFSVADRFNDGKKAELRDRLKHDSAYSLINE